MVNAPLYQRIRLWSGIVSIGTNLGIVLALYFFAGWWPDQWTNPMLAAATLILIPVAVALANLPFEILVGHACESAASRTQQPLKSWLTDWIYEVSRTCFAQAFGLLFFYGAALLHGGTKWAIAGSVAVIVISAGLLRLGSMSRRMRCAFSPDDGFTRAVTAELNKLGVAKVNIAWADQKDTTTVNGCIRPLGDGFILSTTAREHLSPREVALLCAREHWMNKNHIGSRMAATIACGWLAIGLGLALVVPAANPIQAALGGAGIISLWSFAALFVWPRINQIWMQKGDHYLGQLSTPDNAQALLKKIQNLNQTDWSLPPGKSGVFHPIPPLQTRIESLT